MIRFEIPGRLPGLNDIIDMNRRVAWNGKVGVIGASQKKKWTKICAEDAIACGVPVISTPVKVNVTWIEPNHRRDPDNIEAGVKFILDGLVLANRIPNDNQKWIKGITHHHPDEVGEARVIVELTPFSAGSV